MVEETFEAPTPAEAFDIARRKYGGFADLKLVKAKQIKDADGNLVARITVHVEEKVYLKSIGLEESDTEDDDLFSRVEKIFEKRGLRGKWVGKTIAEAITSGVGMEEEKIVSAVLESIEENLAEVDNPDENLGRVSMMVGPAGVGKTTTIAKLAARAGYLSGKERKIAVVNLDTFRSGAYEQMENFARLMHLEHRYIDNISDFREAIEDLSDYDRIFVDTAGISPYDTGRLIGTVEYLKSINSMDISVNLVLSAAAKYGDMLDIYEHFSFVNPDSVILTKFDETASIGELVSFLMEKRLPVAYLSTGQRVPEDLEPATVRRLLEYLVGDNHA